MVVSILMVENKAIAFLIFQTNPLSLYLSAQSLLTKFGIYSLGIPQPFFFFCETNILYFLLISNNLIFLKKIIKLNA